MNCAGKRTNIVGALTLANKSVPPNSVVIGNPFKIIKTRPSAASKL